MNDTIAAIASPPGGAARGVLRLSGPDVRACLEKVFHADDAAQLSAVTRATVFSGSLRLGPGESPLPCDLYFWPTRHSYTGEPAAELHTFGSPPLLEAALRALCRSGGRLARPGEFTLRAFLSGRLDLTRAEAVLGAIDADDDKQFDVALAQLAGGLSDPLRRLRDDLLDLLAHLEAGFDFVEDDLPFITPDQLDRQLAAAAETVARLARQMKSRREAADPARVVLVGWPNTGKSSLFNKLSGLPGALVSTHPGTTRDYLTRELDLDGVKCLLVDTAGVDPAPAGGHRPGTTRSVVGHVSNVPRHDRIEPHADGALSAAVQAASRRQRRAAHCRVLCLDSSRRLNPWERDQLAAGVADRLLVLTKTDLPWRTDFIGKAIPTSSTTGQGIDLLRARVRDAVLSAGTSGGDVVAGTAVRCGESLRLAAESLARARRIISRDAGEELVAAEIRVALEALGNVVGAVYTDDILDRIFSRFCIGK